MSRRTTRDPGVVHQSLVAAFAASDATAYFAHFHPDASFLFHDTPGLIRSRADYEALWAHGSGRTASASSPANPPISTSSSTATSRCSPTRSEREGSSQARRKSSTSERRSCSTGTATAGPASTSICRPSPVPLTASTSMTDAVIADLDGTLCDVAGILHHLEGDERDFAAFHAASADCPPRAEVADAVRAAHDAGKAVLVVTSREFIWRDLTLDWLVGNEIPHDGLAMRIVGDYRADDVVKAEMLYPPWRPTAGRSRRRGRTAQTSSSCGSRAASPCTPSETRHTRIRCGWELSPRKNAASLRPSLAAVCSRSAWSLSIALDSWRWSLGLLGRADAAALGHHPDGRSAGRAPPRRPPSNGSSARSTPWPFGWSPSRRPRTVSWPD